MQYLMALALLLFPFVVSADPTTPMSKEVVMNLSEVYVPGSFNGASNAIIVVSGMFPNSCYKWKRADVTHLNPNSHEVRAIADVTQGLCMMVIVPFQHEVDLGLLVRGQHSLRIVNGDGTAFERTFTVE